MWFVWQVFSRTTGYRRLDKYLRDKGYTRDGKVWRNHEFEVVPCGLWTCTGIQVYAVDDGRWRGWTDINYLDELEDGIGL